MSERIILTEDELIKIQGIVLEMMLEVDRICKKHDITYYLGGGTLLGAVRYKAFIPWDDDGDLIMLRDGYEKFREVVKEELDEKYFFQDYDTDKNSHYIFPKIRRNDSFYATDFGAAQDMHNGMFLDIFIHDKAPDSKLMQKIHMLKTKAYRAMAVATWSNKTYDRKPKWFYGLVNKMIAKTKPEFWNKRLRKLLTKYKNRKTNSSFDGVGEHLSHGFFPYSWLGEPKYMEFCGHEFPVSSDTHNYLIFSYGEDYMTPPPEESRVSNHEVSLVKFPGEPVKRPM